MKENLGIQLFSVRDCLKTYEDAEKTLSALKAAGYSEAQTAGCDFGYDKLGELGRKIGIKMIGTHYGFDELLNDLGTVVEQNRLIGSENIGLGGMVFDSVEAVALFIAQANEIAKKVAAAGMKFTYHNHSHEFGKWENGKTTMQMLAEGLDQDNISFVLDTYWVQYGGGDICKWIEKLAGRIDILHLKDMKVVDFKGWQNKPAITEIGDGNMDWQHIVDTARKCGIKHYIVEQDCNWEPDCITAAVKSANYLINTIN